jgi:hypothetical protein
MVRPAEAEADRDLAGGEIDQVGGDEERTHPARPALVQDDRRLADARQAADAGADHHTRAIAVLVGLRRPAGILDRLAGRGNRADDEAVHLLLVFRLHPLVGIEAAVGRPSRRQLPGDLAAEIGGVERLNRADARLSADQPPPDMTDANAERTHSSQARYDDATHDECSDRA